MSTTGGADSAAAETVSGAADKTPSWRDHLPIHPAADLFPVMSESELRELGEDIKKNGLRYPVILWRENERKKTAYLLDGRNRLDAMELVGVPVLDEDGKLRHWSLREGEPYDLVLSLNVHRRHLTGEQKRELIAKILKAKPEASNRKIAKQTKADHKTVAAVRGDLESTGEIPQLEKTTGADGKRRAKKKKSPAKTINLEPTEYRATESPEIDLEQRKANHAALADPITVEDDLEADEYREAFLLRAADALAFAIYSGEIDKEVIAAAQRVVEKWNILAADLAGGPDYIVERALSLLMAMTDQQRAQFFAKYTELMAERAPARAAEAVRRPPVRQKPAAGMALHGRSLVQPTRNNCAKGARDERQG